MPKLLLEFTVDDTMTADTLHEMLCQVIHEGREVTDSEAIQIDNISIYKGDK